MQRMFLIPNFALYLMTAIIIIWALLLDVFVVPVGETLFEMNFLEEFMMVFVGLWLTILIVYYKKHGHREHLIRACHYIGAFAAIYITLNLCCNIKSLITILPPLHLDETIIHIERITHFGTLPNVAASQWLEGQPWLYHFLDDVYISWFFVIFFYLCFIILSEPGRRSRERYMFSFAALWFFAGNLAAIAASSVGPVFLGDFFTANHGGDSFRQVVAASLRFERHSAGLDLAATGFQEMLLGFVHNQSVIDPNGPSAMPSLHVGVAALMLFHSFSVDKRLFGVMLVYFLLIFAGSVALQWHYAVDGYLATAMALIIWKLSGFLPLRMSTKLQAGEG